MTNTPTVYENSYHIDIGNLRNNDEKLRQWTTSIYYLNSNNGYTEFEDGTKIESVANRLVLIDGSQKHCSTNCTDETVRVNIGVNYF